MEGGEKEGRRRGGGGGVCWESEGGGGLQRERRIGVQVWQSSGGNSVFVYMSSSMATVGCIVNGWKTERWEGSRG